LYIILEITQGKVTFAGR